MSGPNPPQYHVFDGIIYRHRVPAATLIKIRDELKLHPSNIVIATYPKSGTTWMQEIVYSIMEGSQKARERTQCMDNFIRFLEFDAQKPGVPSNYDQVVATAPPHIIKTHLNASFFKRALETTEEGPKFIVIVRNPKDTLVSFYHHHQRAGVTPSQDSWDEYFELFKQNKLPYGNVLDHHVAWWSHHNHKNVLLLHYETMLADSTKAIRQVADFLGHHLSEEELAAIHEVSSFKTMKARGFTSYHCGAPRLIAEKITFFRSGRKGDWRKYFSDAQSDYVDQLIETMATPLGLSYTF